MFDYRHYLRNTGTLVQLGAFDGVMCEVAGVREIILHNENYTCHLVEPLRNAFQNLKINYQNAKSQIHYHNIAIYETDGFALFNEHVSDYGHGVFSSFVNKSKSASKEIVVPTKTLKTLFNENNITEITGLFVDVEGVEEIIFQQLFETTTVRPEVIRFEFPHLDEPGKLINYIEQQGYTVKQCIYEWCDKICVRNDVPNLLKLNYEEEYRKWKGL
jgi:FkbM family methyltransferase